MDDERDELDPASYAHWRESGYRGRPPWRRGYRSGYLAVSLGLVVLFLLLLVVVRLSA